VDFFQGAELYQDNEKKLSLPLSLQDPPGLKSALKRFRRNTGNTP
jgi:hypothetical protein